MKTIEIIGLDPRTGNGLHIAVRDGRIAEVAPADVTSELWLSAGLIDLQVNGYRGFDVNASDVSAETVCSLAREMLRTGVTTFAPTLITGPQQHMLANLRAIARAIETDAIAAACIPFIHVEGPYISPADGYRGAHPMEHVRPPSIAEYDAWQQASGNRIGLITVSPHHEGIVPFIKHAVKQGTLISIGHTHATTKEIRAAVNAGATLSTHLGNGLPGTLKRHPNPIWSQMAEDRLQAMFIADGHHLAPEVFRAMLRSKGAGNSILVSDCVALAGMPPGKYTAPIGGEVELSADGRLSMAGSELLAGAAVPLITCVGRAVSMSGLPLADVLPMATVNPGKLVGGRGALAAGMRADIIAFRWNPAAFRTSIESVWLAGEAVS